jgi:MFS family permease
MGLTTDPTDAELYNYSNEIIGTILGLFAAGAFFGAIFAGWYCDAYGRKQTLIVAAVINIVGGALQAGSVHVGMFIAARFITGFAAGQYTWGLTKSANDVSLANRLFTAMFVSMVPLYIAEVAPPAVRGLLVGQHGS